MAWVAVVAVGGGRRSGCWRRCNKEVVTHGCGYLGLSGGNMRMRERGGEREKTRLGWRGWRSSGLCGDGRWRGLGGATEEEKDVERREEMGMSFSRVRVTS